MSQISDEARKRFGRGKGAGKNYVPWIKTTDLCSNGRASRLLGTRRKRIHHFLSDLERDFFTIVEFDKKVIDIREQYPLLPLESTQEIAGSYGIRHPADRNGDIVMTSDFVVTYLDENGGMSTAIRTIKPADKLSSRRVLEKFAIEEEYWRRNGITNWKVVTDEQINKAEAKSIGVLNGYLKLPEETAPHAEDFMESLRQARPETALKDFIRGFEGARGLGKGDGEDIYRHLLATQRLGTDLKRGDFGLALPVREVRIC